MIPPHLFKQAFELVASHRLTDRLGVNGSGTYQKNDFAEGRRDNNYFSTIGLQYRTVEWLGLQINYLFGTRDSNDNAFDYYSNAILVSIQALL